MIQILTVALMFTIAPLIAVSLHYIGKAKSHYTDDQLKSMAIFTFFFALSVEVVFTFVTRAFRVWGLL